MSSVLSTSRLRRLPLVTLYLTERCNSRCVTCDYWRHGRLDASLDFIQRLIPSLSSLSTRVALISGGEPLLNAQWHEIASLLKGAGIKPWLLTSGLSLAKHAERASQLFDAITVSLDGTNARTYQAIRGLDAFDKVCEGIRAAVSAGSKVGVRVTLQRANYKELPLFVDLARRLGVNHISFLAVDVANPHAFGRTDDFSSDLALSTEDLPVFGDSIAKLEADRAADFESRFIAESPAKLRRLQQYFAAVQGRAPYPAVRCNAPEFSAVVGVKGAVQPCFFIAGQGAAANEGDLESVLNLPAMMELRDTIRAGRRPECVSCVCSLYRDPDNVDELLLP
ncbi:MAG: radical SAM protein [Proteobacteria bacterium]|nr:radical SAM protein [Pseudomonadota bacterium]